MPPTVTCKFVKDKGPFCAGAQSNGDPICEKVVTPVDAAVYPFIVPLINGTINIPRILVTPDCTK